MHSLVSLTQLFFIDTKISKSRSAIFGREKKKVIKVLKSYVDIPTQASGFILIFKLFYN